MAARGVELPLAPALSLLAVLLLSLCPLPLWLMPARPDWAVLWVMWWVTRRPQQFSLGWAWVGGLILDGVSGGVIGRHALALVVVAYVCVLLGGRMQIYSLLQQMAVVFLVTLLDQVLCHWAQNLSGHTTPSLVFLMACLSSALCWPLLLMLGGRERRMDASWGAPHN